MADYGIGEYIAIASALATTASTAASIYSQANQPGPAGVAVPEVPTPPTPPPSQGPLTPMGLPLPPGERYNKPPTTTGANQPFLANLVPDQTAESNLDVLSQIRKSLG